jgi:hypothetical protein
MILTNTLQLSYGHAWHRRRVSALLQAFGLLARFPRSAYLQALGLVELVDIEDADLEVLRSSDGRRRRASQGQRARASGRLPAVLLASSK